MLTKSVKINLFRTLEINVRLARVQGAVVLEKITYIVMNSELLVILFALFLFPSPGLASMIVVKNRPHNHWSGQSGVGTLPKFHLQRIVTV